MNLSGCASLMELPDCTGIPNLKELTLVECESLVEVHHSVGSLDRLETLDVVGCSKLVTLPREISLKSVQKISLIICERLEEFPKLIGKMDSLRKLDLSGSGIKDLHPSIRYLIGLKYLSLSWCENLTTLPCSIVRLQNLEKLDLSGCSKFATFPETNRKMDSFRRLDLSDTDMKELHPSIGNLIGLKYLFLSGCENLSTLPCSIYGLQNLEWLFLRGCSKLVTFPTKPKSLHDDNGDGSLSLPKLNRLIMNGCNLSDCDFLTTLDCLETLTEPDLSSNSFVSLPACISKFVNLEKIDLHHCNRLREIPELPPKLVEVDVSDCKWINNLGYDMDKSDDFWLDNQFDSWDYERLSDYLGHNMDKLERISSKNHARRIVRNLRSIIPNRKLSMETKAVGFT